MGKTYEKHMEERLGQLESSGLDNAVGMSKRGRVFGLGALHNKVLPACDVSCMHAKLLKKLK
ncbi:hypothetical protein HID58_041150 [Brassica napus]|uniref:Uncharacterized protein n=1 Tax=Brassica napus TaxID=3708 RepID=A0ABQ8BA09_BRANA|nr:hypothetical protein HID58_041150 [Brassica napus]